jgi:hypothetical protein
MGGVHGGRLGGCRGAHGGAPIVCVPRGRRSGAAPGRVAGRAAWRMPQGLFCEGATRGAAIVGFEGKDGRFGGAVRTGRSLALGSVCGYSCGLLPMRCHRGAAASPPRWDPFFRVSGA